MNNRNGEGVEAMRIEYHHVVDVAHAVRSIGAEETPADAAHEAMAQLTENTERTQVLGPWLETIIGGTVQDRLSITPSPGGTETRTGSNYPSKVHTLEGAASITVARGEIERLVADADEETVPLAHDPRWERVPGTMPILYVKEAFDANGAVVRIPSYMALTEVRRIGVEVLVPHYQMLDVTCLRGHWDQALEAALGYEGDGVDASWEGTVGPYITTNAGEGEDPSDAHHVPAALGAKAVVKRELEIE